MKRKYQPAICMLYSFSVSQALRVPEWSQIDCEADTRPPDPVRFIRSLPRAPRGSTALQQAGRRRGSSSPVRPYTSRVHGSPSVATHCCGLRARLLTLPLETPEPDYAHSPVLVRLLQLSESACSWPVLAVASAPAGLLARTASTPPPAHPPACSPR